MPFLLVVDLCILNLLDKRSFTLWKLSVGHIQTGRMDLIPL